MRRSSAACYECSEPVPNGTAEIGPVFCGQRAAPLAWVGAGETGRDWVCRILDCERLRADELFSTDR
jgi:hypothetical protein